MQTKTLLLRSCKPLQRRRLTRFRIIGQCAVAVAPDAIAEVQTVITKFAAAGGGGAYVLAAPPVAPINSAPSQPTGISWPRRSGPTPGGPGGFPLFTPALQLPIVSNPQSITASTNTNNNGTNGTPGDGPGNSEENESSAQDRD